MENALTPEKENVMTAVNGRMNSPTTGAGDGGAPTGVQANAFSRAASGSSSAGLTVSGNTIDTGRYVITGSNGYTRPNDSIAAGDGMVSIMDKTTNSFVDVYGDPHVYTSDGDRAEFQKNGLEIDLADGTQVQFKPTAETNGFSHIDSLAVTKRGQTVVESGFYSADGSAKVTTSTLQQGGAGSAQGFNDPNRTVMTTAQGGGLNTLVNAAGVQLSDKTNQTSLDGMGGAAKTPGAVSPELVSLLQKLVTLLLEQISASVAGSAGSGALVSGAMPGQASQPTPGQAAGSGSAAGVSSVQQSIGLLQGELASLSSGAAPVSPTAPRPATASPQGASPASGTAVASPDGQAGLLRQIVSLLQQLLTQLSGSAAGGTQSAGPASANVASLLKQLLPVLEQLAQTGRSAGGPAAPDPTASGAAGPSAAQSGPGISVAPNTGIANPPVGSTPGGATPASSGTDPASNGAVSGKTMGDSSSDLAAALSWTPAAGLTDRAQIAAGYQPGTGNGANNIAGNRR